MQKWIVLPVLVILTAVVLAPFSAPSAESSPASFPQCETSTKRYLAPVVVAPAGENKLAVLGSVGRRILLVNSTTGNLLRTISLPAEGSGMAVRNSKAFVTTGEPAGRLLQIDLHRGCVEQSWRVGHWPMAPLISADEKIAFLANRFEHRVRSIDLETGAQRTANVIREPVAMVLDRRGTRLFVANHLPRVRPFLDDENPTIYSEVSVVDTKRMEVIRTIALPNGSHGLRGIARSPNGNCVVVTHILSNYVVPTMEITRGAMNRNALSVLRTGPLDLLATLVLDDPQRGAANPWGICFSSDDKKLIVSHAGTNEISVIDWAALHELAEVRSSAASLFDEESLNMMTGLRRRIALPLAGPRTISEKAGTVFAAGFFSDNIATIDVRQQPAAIRLLKPETPMPPSKARRGEQLFNDATLCLQHWQSCATCHPDGRADALYWDLLNDGIGNTKNTKSLLMAALTPPVMSRGVRADAGMAVASGIRHIQFADPSPDQTAAIEQYLLEMKVVPSPHLNADVLETPKTEAASCSKCHYPGVPRGTLTESARRGKTLFEGKAGCSACHPHPYFTSMETVGGGLGTGVKYDVPSLVGVWRSAPYLHHGDALSLEDTITDFNHLQLRGQTENLSRKELDDLLEYLQSL